SYACKCPFDSEVRVEGAANACELRNRDTSPTMPLGAHSTVAMKTMPITAVCSSKKLLTQLRSPRKMPAPRNGPTILPEPPTIAIKETSTEIWKEAATG